jgi:ribosome maturation factor RimP
MSHPIIPRILELAAPVAEALGLEVVSAVFQTNQSPPVLRVDVRRLDAETGLEDCSKMSRAFEPCLDEAEVLPDAYVLEISSPGIDRALSSDREFISFRGFPVHIMATQIHDGHQEWFGNLVGRDEEFVHLNQKGRASLGSNSMNGQNGPRACISTFQLNTSNSIIRRHSYV